MTQLLGKISSVVLRLYATRLYPTSVIDQIHLVAIIGAALTVGAVLLLVTGVHEKSTAGDVVSEPPLREDGMGEDGKDDARISIRKKSRKRFPNLTLTDHRSPISLTLNLIIPSLHPPLYPPLHPPLHPHPHPHPHPRPSPNS